MSDHVSDSNLNLDSTKTPERPSHEALEQKSPTHLDQSAMDSAKRAQNRIHNDEENIPGSTIFSK